MIDPTKCKYEETHEDPLDRTSVHYFTYPKEGLEEYGDFYGEEDYGNVVSACISLTRDARGNCYLQMSPTVEYEDCLMDVDWRDLYEGRHYNAEIVLALLNKAYNAGKE